MGAGGPLYRVLMICVCDISALEFYRSQGRAVSDVLELPRTSKLGSCSAPSALVAKEDLGRAGIHGVPYHCLVSSSRHQVSGSGVMVHVREKALPARALVRVTRDVLVPCPELLFCSLAANPDIDVIDLALVGYELCGRYLVDEDPEAWDGFINHSEPLTSRKKIRAFMGKMVPFHGASKARQAFELVRDGSNSPMETVLAVLLVAPRSVGGLGVRGSLELNQPVRTLMGTRYVDLLLNGVGIEYKGREAHSLEKVGRDDRRQNHIVGTGLPIFNVWYESLASDAMFLELAKEIYRAMGKRLRIESRAHHVARQCLRRRLLPVFRRCDPGPR